MLEERLLELDEYSGKKNKGNEGAESEVGADTALAPVEEEAGREGRQTNHLDQLQHNRISHLDC